MGHKAIPGFCVPFGVQTNRFERLHLHGNCYISQMTFITLVEEICLSLHESGFRRFILCIIHSETKPRFTSPLRTLPTITTSNQS